MYVEHLAEGVAKLVTGDYPGIHHVAGKDWVSMFQFAGAIAKAFQLDSRLVVPQTEDPGLSPSRETQSTTEGILSADKLGLDCTQTIQLLGLQQTSLAEGLTQMRTSG